MKSNVSPVVVLHPAVKGFPGTVNTFLVRSFHDVDSPALFLKHASFLGIALETEFNDVQFYVTKFDPK